MKPHEREKLQKIADEIVQIIVDKEKVYGSSWKDHGGFSAFFNLHRKYSRVEHGAEKFQYDLFKSTIEIPEGVDSLQDLVAYALLTLSEVYEPTEFPTTRADTTVVEEVSLPEREPDFDDKVDAAVARLVDEKKEEEGDAGPGYVNQDR